MVYLPPSAVSILCIGWLQVVGSFKLHVSFAEYRLFYRALLQKRPIILRSLLIVATPYQCDVAVCCCSVLLQCVVAVRYCFCFCVFVQCMCMYLQGRHGLPASFCCEYTLLQCDVAV